MRRTLHIARREWLEQRRQPVMLGMITTLAVLLAGLTLTNLMLLDAVSTDPERIVLLGELAGGDGQTILNTMTDATLAMYSFLLFTQYLGVSAVLAGHAMLHDRQTGTLAFLLLAPVRRSELLAGKVLGALGPATLIYLVVSGVACSLASLVPVTAPFAARLPPSPAFLIAFLLGGPTWAAFVGTVCTTLSSVVRDVRTAQQGVWFVVFFATLFCGYLLSGLLTQGPALQLGVFALGLACTASALFIGASVLGHDLRR